MLIACLAFGQIESTDAQHLPEAIELKSKTDIPFHDQALDSMSSELNLIQDERLGAFVEHYNEQKKVKGYRIQLYSGSSRMEAAQVRSDFINKYEEERPELIYQQPNFKIRVGNYRDRAIAAKFLALYKIDFQSAFIVKAEISFDE